MSEKTIFTIYQKQDAENQFLALADKLFNHYVLVTPAAKYRLTEIEFYYTNICSEEIEIPDHFPLEAGIPYMLEDFHQTGFPHPDPYTHGFGNQHKSDYWYLHSNGNSLKNGNYKGLDLTIGNEGEFSFGGILLRGIRNISGGDYINGPSKVVDRIMKDLKKTSINDMADILTFSVLDKNNEIYLSEYTIDDSAYKREVAIQTTRFGLKNKLDEKENFIDRPYRFIIELIPAHKFKNKEKAIRQLLLENRLAKEEAKIILGYNISLQ